MKKLNKEVFLELDRSVSFIQNKSTVVDQDVSLREKRPPSIEPDQTKIEKVDHSFIHEPSLLLNNSRGSETSRVHDEWAKQNIASL